MNLQESIRRILRESLESEWNEGNYDYQHGFCHYFAYNIIDKIRERFPNKKVNYYLLLANEVNKDTDEVEQDYLLHAYIKIGDKLLDSNGFTTMDEVEQRVDDWYNRQLTMTPEEYDINVWEEESDEIPEMFFNNQFCNTKRVKEDMEKFLSHPSVQKLFKDTLNESEDRSGKYTKAVKVIVNDFKNEDFVCDIDVYYYADKYEVAVKIDKKEFEKKYENLDINYANILMVGYLDRLKRTIRQEIKNFLPVDVLVWFKQINCDKGLNESESKTYSSLHKLLNMLFDGFDNADYDWANYMCGMGECCDPYAIGFTLPDKDYDDYIFKLVDGEMYDDDGDYPKEFQDELPEPCFQLPDLNNPRFNTIVFYGLYAEEIEDYMGHAHNWNLDLLKIINNQFGCDAKRIVII